MRTWWEVADEVRGGVVRAREWWIENETAAIKCRLVNAGECQSRTSWMCRQMWVLEAGVFVEKWENESIFVQPRARRGEERAWHARERIALVSYREKTNVRRPPRHASTFVFRSRDLLLGARI